MNPRAVGYGLLLSLAFWIPALLAVWLLVRAV